MDTADSGSTSVVSVTLTGKAVGTSDVGLTVAAVGDESGTAYNVTSARDGTLTVESGENTTETPTPTPTATETPTETPTEEDSSSSGGSNDDGDNDGGDDDDGSDSSGSDSGDTVTATDTPTVTEPTPSDTPTTATETEHSTETDTKQSTSTQTSSGGPAITPSQTAATDNAEPSGGSPTNLLIAGSMIVAVLGGITIYRRL
ncbi:hypothetical protein [Haloarcula sp. CGMCC 1.6347]|uniref:hypothetical protein n=1 Tax=Haloarcula sp. CGMCC 1.6347 TaxID=3111455 RepID=UPI003FA5A854